MIEYLDMSLKRILLAFVLSPLATPLCFAVVWVLFGTLDFESMWKMLLLIGAFAYATALLFGIPLVIATRRLKRRDKAIFIVVGALAGLSVATVIGLGFGWFGGFRFYLLCCIAGILSSFAFWLIAFAKKLEAVELSPSN
jgi:hypothetical protein